MTTNGKIQLGDRPYNGKVIVYIVKADQTSYINYMKPLILIEELGTPYEISIIDTTSQEYYAIHPERYVPALKDWCPDAKKDIIIFESTACLQYLGERYDLKGAWTGQTAGEKAEILSWTAYQTAGLGPTAKYWLYFLKGYPNRRNPEPPVKAVEKLHANVVKQWDILEKRLSLPNQLFIALCDRPTIADISYFPYAMPWMFNFLNVNISGYPNIQAWGDRMVSRRAVKDILERGPTYGHDVGA
ncbi:glutathione S-transferase [Byssothecium circinans]|uniref:glutathione transferase n=1 Tax=Byssothecium circinans TaxID=147558 RepID=A0A6A5TC67_9PLEO|nr:glutathione S-transferase [Byssothecium circinans]